MFPFRKKYQIRGYVKIDNPPYNDCYFLLGKIDTVYKRDYEKEVIWTKHDKLEELLAKPYITKKEILNACHFPKQRDALAMVLKR